MKETSEEFFNWYELHDISVSKLNFDFEKCAVTLILCDFDDENDAEVALQLTFNKVNKFSIKYDENICNFEIRAIFEKKLTRIGTGYELFLSLIMPEKVKKDGKFHELLAGEMCIGFEDLEVIGGLNREQMLQKWREED
jgi:hypothetical protein